jgi:trimeric autotransporter adhesin
VQALQGNTTGVDNTANGLEALYNNTTGTDNTATGYAALYENTTGHDNTALRIGAGDSVTTADNVIAIGASGANVSNSCFIGQIYSNIQPVVGTDPDYVTINSAGRLGRANVSSRRYKHDIEPIGKASEVLFALKPVSFRYNKQYDATQTIAFGLIAEEVAEVNPALVGRNDKGQPESVRYEQINARLLNEFLKEHREVEKQNRKTQEQESTINELKSTAAKQETSIAQQRKDFQATIAQQQKEIQALTASLQEQASQIQKVSAQLEVKKPAPRTVLNDQ